MIARVLSFAHGAGYALHDALDALICAWGGIPYL